MWRSHGGLRLELLNCEAFLVTFDALTLLFAGEAVRHVVSVVADHSSSTLMGSDSSERSRQCGR